MARCTTCNRELPLGGVCAACSSASSEPTILLPRDSNAKSSPGSGPEFKPGSSVDTLLPSPPPVAGSDALPARSSQTLRTSPPSGVPSHSGQQMAPGTVLASRYRIVAPIGRGGMGQVYRAEDLKLGETVALKFLPDALAQDTAWLGRFFMEVRTAREVTHPNVCRVHDVIETTGPSGHPLYFLTMEYVDGENLADLVKRFGRLPTEKAMEIAGQITAALAAAHEKGVLHRDIKPANVMIDGRGQAKLADFGLAVAGNSVQAAEIAGTPGYIAPEILRNGQATGRSDLYSLGLVLYELLTGRKAVKDGKAVTGSVRQYAPEVSPAAEKTVMECMDTDPARRPASAMEVLRVFPAKNALEAALARGETPSPEMVANSADEQPMALWKAWTLASAVVAILLLTWLVAGRGGYMGVKPPQLSTDEMRGRAQQYLRDFDYPTAVPAQRILLMENYALLDWFSAHATPQQKRDFNHSPQGSALLYYEQSATENLLPPDGVGITPSGDPTIPHAPPGSQQLQIAKVDSDGNLLQLYAPPNGTKGTVDWQGVARATGLDAKSITAAPAVFTPPLAADDLRAWTGWYPGHSEFPVRVEAAAWHGRLDYLNVTAPWDNQQKLLSVSLADTGFLVVRTVALACGFLLALYNLRRKRGDVQAATRLALFLLMITLPVFVIGVQHGSPSLLDYFSALINFLAMGLLVAATLWITYIAVEPLTRKRLPQLLVASSLILQGRWRSVRVGREVLVGTAVGVAIELWYQTAHAMQWTHMPGSTLDVFTLEGEHGFAGFLVQWLLNIVGSVLNSAHLLVLFTLVVIIVRNRWVAIVLVVVLNLATSTSRGSLLAAASVLLALMLGQGYLLMRVGAVAVVVASTISTVADTCAWPHTLSSWMAPQMWWVVLSILGVTAFGFWLAIGDQRPWGSLRLED